MLKVRGSFSTPQARDRNLEAALGTLSHTPIYGAGKQLLEFVWLFTKEEKNWASLVSLQLESSVSEVGETGAIIKLFHLTSLIYEKETWLQISMSVVLEI